MDGAPQTDLTAVRAAAETCCRAACKAQEQMVETLCRDAFRMACADDRHIRDRATCLARDATDGNTAHDILTVEADGGMARVKPCVGVPGVLYEDHPGLVRVDGAREPINKLFQTCDGPAAAG